MRAMRLLCLVLGVALWSHQAPAQGQDGRAGRGRGRGPTPGQNARALLQRIATNQDEIRKLTLSLQDALRKLNALRRIPLNDPASKEAPDEMRNQEIQIVKLVSAIYRLSAGADLAEIIVSQQPSIGALSADEAQVLRDSGFSANEIADINAVLATAAKAQKINVNGDVAQLEKEEKRVADREQKIDVARVLKFGAGGLLIGFDIGSRFIPMLNVLTALEAVNSVTSGAALIADGLHSDKPGNGDR